MEYFYFITIFLFGIVIGSFLNVCIYRLPLDGMSIIKPGSFCPGCNTSIRWYQNIPLFSFLILRGKCAKCSARISLRYPLVELLTGAFFVMSAYWYLAPFDNLADGERMVQFIVAIYLISILIVATFIDIEFRIIPDELTISGIILALLVSAFFPSLHKAIFPALPSFVNGLIGSLAGIIVGGGVIYLVGIFGKLVFRKEAMGFGDVKLMAFLGGFMGWESTLYIFLMACFIGSIIGIILYFITKDHYIAFGPYIALAALVVMFFKPQIEYLMFHQYPEFIKGVFLTQ
ncbi:MAG TPA: prepilin peptidase [Planctomycetota bacterium]|nr:prepilin peptidase [Planctomycetota bacterium]